MIVGDGTNEVRRNVIAAQRISRMASDGPARAAARAAGPPPHG
jgi:sulfur relay (sulfurtransferase) DsrC/TusE family protein